MDFPFTGVEFLIVA